MTFQFINNKVVLLTCVK